MVSKNTVRLLSLGLAITCLPAVHAASVVKADTNTLNNGIDWVGGVAPTIADIAQFNTVISAPNAAALTLGANLSWKGLSIGTVNGPIVIGAGNTLTLGTSGIDMTSATQNLTIASGLALGAGNQTWNVATGRTLTVSGAISRSAGSTVLIDKSTNTGIVTASPTLTNGVLPWAIVRSSGTAANNSANGYTFGTVTSGNIVPYTAATAVTTGYPAASAATNYDWSSAGTQGAIGSSRAANTIRYTGTGVTQQTNSTQTETFNALINAGSGTVTLGGGSIMNLTSSSGELVLGAMSANIVINGPITGAIALTTLGGSSQTVTLGGVSTFTGATNVNSGTLLVSGTGSINTTSGININGGKYIHTSSVASTRTIALNNGTLDGTGTVGAVTVANNAANVVAHGNGATTALTLGSLTFNGAAGVNINYGSGAGLAVTGALATSGTDGAITLTLTGTLTPSTTSNLISYGSWASADANDFTLVTTLLPRASKSLGLNGNNLAVTIGANDSPVWTGLSSSTWTTATTGDSTGPNNWALKTAHTATNFWTGDTAEFNDTYNIGAGDVAVSNTAVSITGGNVSPASTTFNNSAVNYTVSSGDGSGIAAGTIIKSGTGSVTISNTNTTTGAVTVNAGTLLVNNGGTLGSGAITISAGTLQVGDGATDGSIASNTGIANNGSLIYNLIGNQSFAGAITGGGTLTKSGAGTLTLSSGSSTYSGGTTISGGGISISTGAALGTGAVSIGSGTTLTATAGVTLANTFTGSGSYLGNAGQTVISGNWTGFSGTFSNATAADTSFVNNATAGIYNGTSAGAAYVNNYTGNNTNGMIVANTTGSPLTVKMGSYSSVALSNLRNSGGSTGAVTYEIGNLNTDTTVAGGIGGIGATAQGGSVLALTKVGTGTMTLSGATGNGYTGGTTISGGKLSITNTSGSATGSGAVALSGGTTSTLQGTGTASGAVTVTNGSRLAPGVNTTGTNTNFGAAGTLTLSGALTLTSANMDFDLSSAAASGNDRISTAGALTLSSTISFTFNSLNGSFETGTPYTLISGASAVSGFDATALASNTLYSGLAGNSYSAVYSLSGNDLQVSFTAIPEPHQWGILLGGMLAVMAIVRRRKMAGM